MDRQLAAEGAAAGARPRAAAPPYLRSARGMDGGGGGGAAAGRVVAAYAAALARWMPRLRRFAAHALTLFRRPRPAITRRYEHVWWTSSRTRPRCSARSSPARGGAEVADGRRDAHQMIYSWREVSHSPPTTRHSPLTTATRSPALLLHEWPTSRLAAAPAARQLRLTRNYRSTPQILAVAAYRVAAGAADDGAGGGAVAAGGAADGSAPAMWTSAARAARRWNASCDGRRQEDCRHAARLLRRRRPAAPIRRRCSAAPLPVRSARRRAPPPRTRTRRAPVAAAAPPPKAKSPTPSRTWHCWWSTPARAQQPSRASPPPSAASGRRE